MNRFVPGVIVDYVAGRALPRASNWLKPTCGEKNFVSWLRREGARVIVEGVRTKGGQDRVGGRVSRCCQFSGPMYGTTGPVV